MTYSANTCTAANSLSCTEPRARFSLLSFMSNRIALLRQRHVLKALDDQALEDIGISRQEALQEANRPIWDAPNNWKS